ncbi:MAG: 5'/3'-nucleotidase SurE [Candidatus Zixiibacteriota bacterium]|nr:MAG: 5'/3'-nucleotidase SurE [candidate division Zixibacteria bacterium]
MSEKKLILITNDDGYFSDGVNALFNTLASRHEVFMVAPDREQSASSHSLTLDRPLRVHKIDENKYVTDGTPTDCVMLAVHLIFGKRRPDMIISGINHGANMGDDITYSGTVAAAIEGAILRIPSVAVSMANYEPRTPMTRAARFAAKIVDQYDSLEIPPSVFLNINLPLDDGTVYRDYEFTSQGFRRYKDIVIKKTDPRGRPYYWIGGEPEWKNTQGTDFACVNEGHVSVTPMCLEFTDMHVLGNLKSRKLRL